MTLTEEDFRVELDASWGVIGVWVGSLSWGWTGSLSDQVEGKQLVW